MKGGFDELKAACGSQFLQYLAKTALASRMALNEQKLAILNDAIPMNGKCAGCNMPCLPLGDLRRKQCNLTKTCEQVVECERKFCQGKPDFHTCSSCGRKGWCQWVTKSTFEVLICRLCQKAICGNMECVSNCCLCIASSVCKSCSGAITNYTTLSGSFEHAEVWLCALHRDVFIKDEAIILACKECYNSLQSPPLCDHLGCSRYFCPHGTTNQTQYCPEHAGDYK